MLPLCQDQKIAVIPFSPLARGWLTRQPTNASPRAQTDELVKTRYTQEDNMTIIQQVSEIAKAHDLPMAQVALAWMLSKSVVTAPIIGATKPHHLEDAIAAISIRLTAEEIQRLEETYRPHPIIGHS